MTDGIPDRMDIEIEEVEVKNDVDTYLKSMAAIRHIEKIDRNITPEARDEYLHLSYRLASALEGLADESVQKNLKIIEKSISQNKELLNYDFMQEGFWKAAAPETNKALDRILISLRREEFSDITEKHHVMQAAKYLISKDASDDEKIEIYSSILPFSTPTMEHNKEMFDNEIKKSKIKKIDTTERGLVLKIKDDKQLEMMVNEAADLGFDQLRVFTTTEKFREAEKKYSRTSLVDPDPKNLELAVLKSEKKGKRRQTISKVLSKMKFLTYPIVGMAPYYLQQKLQDYAGVDSFKAEDATGIAVLGKGGLSLAFLAFGGVTEAAHEIFDVWKGLTDSLNWAGAYGIAGVSFVDEIIRAAWICRDDASNEASAASPLGKIAYLPLELLWRTADYIRTPKGGNKNCLIEIALNKEEYKQQTPSEFNQFTKISEQEISQEGKTSLEWNNKNHHSFGKRYLGEILKSSRRSYQKFKDRKNNAINIYQRARVGEYHRLDMITCFQEEKYVTSLITPEKIDAFEQMNLILKEKKEGNKKVSDIGTKADAEFVRIIKYDKGKIIEDYEALK